MNHISENFKVDVEEISVDPGFYANPIEMAIGEVSLDVEVVFI